MLSVKFFLLVFHRIKIALFTLQDGPDLFNFLAALIYNEPLKYNGPLKTKKMEGKKIVSCLIPLTPRSHPSIGPCIKLGTQCCNWHG
jgi:hypothetical protein